MDVVPINVDVMRRGLIDPESCLADPWGPMSPVSSVQMMRCLLVLTRSVPSKDAKARWRIPANFGHNFRDDFPDSTGQSMKYPR